MALEALGREDEALEHYRRMLPLAAELDRDLPRANDCLWSSDGSPPAGGALYDQITVGAYARGDRPSFA